jgi:NAD(P)-dependent dehydrogenase (short-subunit alcohol dehydrogenase family)
VLAARNVAKLEAVARAVNGLAVPTDVSRFEDLTALVERKLAAHGRLDVLVNNAPPPMRTARSTRSTRRRSRT